MEYGDPYQPTTEIALYHNKTRVYVESNQYFGQKNLPTLISRPLSQWDSRSQIKYNKIGGGGGGAWGKKSYSKLIVNLLGSVSDENGQKTWSFGELGSH